MKLNKARKGIPDWLQQIEKIKAPKYSDSNTRRSDFNFLSLKKDNKVSQTSRIFSH